MISICSSALLAVILASASWPWIWYAVLGRPGVLDAFSTWMLEDELPGCAALSLLGDQLLELLLQLLAVEPGEQVPLLDALAVVDGDLDDDPGDRGVDVPPLLGQERAPALDRQLPGDERQDQR